MAVNSCRKGKRGELMFAKILRDFGFPSAKRGQQHKGGTDSPDVLCVELSGIHFEVKHGSEVRLGLKSLDTALTQAQEEAGMCYASTGGGFDKRKQRAVVAWHVTGQARWWLTWESETMGQQVTTECTCKVLLKLNGENA